MDLSVFFRSVVDQDDGAIVICDLDHNILYMNPAADSRHKKHGGGDLVGKSLLDCHGSHSREIIRRVVEWFGESREHNIMFTFHNDKTNEDKYMIALRDREGTLIGYYEKHVYRNPETARPCDF